MRSMWWLFIVVVLVLNSVGSGCAVLVSGLIVVVIAFGVMVAR